MLIRPIQGTEAAGARLAADIIAASPITPSRPWTTFAPDRALLDGDAALWTLSDDGRTVERMVVLSCACAHTEFTSFQDGEEVSRTVVVIE